jgi:hypothetical protein
MLRAVGERGVLDFWLAAQRESEANLARRIIENCVAACAKAGTPRIWKKYWKRQ